MAWADVAWISLLGIFGYGVGSLGTLYGLKWGGTTSFALMSAIGPILTSLFSIWFLSEKPKRNFFYALPLSVFGLLLVVFGKYQLTLSNLIGYAALVIFFAYVCEALVFVFSKRFQKKVSLPQYLVIAQLATAFFMWISQVAYFKQFHQVLSLSSDGLASLLFVSIVACVLCYAILYWLLNYVEGHKLALFDGLHTLSAVSFGVILFGEKLNLFMIIGGGLILFAVLLANVGNQKKAAN